MYFAAQNLFSQMHQALDSQHVTVAFFKRYTRTPENHAFKYYFRHIGPGGLPGCNFIPYMRKRAHYSLNRYITRHRRKKDPILCSFNRIKTSILELLQQCITVTTASNGLKGQCTLAQPIGLGSEPLDNQSRPERATYSTSPTTRDPDRVEQSLKPLKTQNKPNLKVAKSRQVIFSNRLKTKDDGLETEKNKPKRTQFLGLKVKRN